MKVITRYQCETCGQEYLTKAFAEACESHVLSPCPVTVGQSVKVYERYDEPTEDVVKRIYIAPGIAANAAGGWEASHGEDAYRLFSERVSKELFHQWRVEVAHTHQIGKDWFTEDVSIDNIMVDGAYLNGRAA